MRFRASSVAITIAGVFVAGATAAWLGLHLGGPRHIPAGPCGTESYVGRFEMARRLAVAQPYRTGVAGSKDPGAWVFVVADDMDGQTEVHFVKRCAEAAGSVVGKHREVRLDGLATSELRFIDIDANGEPEVIVRVAGASYSRIVIISFEATQGHEILFDDTEWPPAFRTYFCDLDGDRNYELIREVEAWKFALREDSRKWPSVSGHDEAYMIYRLRHGTYGLTKVTGEKPNLSESRSGGRRAHH